MAVIAVACLSNADTCQKGEREGDVLERLHGTAPFEKRLPKAPLRVSLASLSTCRGIEGRKCPTRHVAIVLQTFNTSTMRRERCTIFMKREIIRLHDPGADPRKK